MAITARSLSCLHCAALLALSSLALTSCPAPPLTDATSPSTASSASTPTAPAPAPSPLPTPSPSASASVAQPVATSSPAQPTPTADPRSPPVRKYTTWVAGDIPPGEREAKAIAARSDTVKKLFADAGVAFPPASLLLRAFKSERELEVWATTQKNGQMEHVSTYQICGASGELGPKRSEGDMQVPEGFYTIHYLWPISNYHLEMKVGYPNASDRILGAKQPGGDIMIHGSCASIGCLAMTDERIEELWVMASAVIKGGAKVHVHILPARDIAKLLADKERAAHWEFWSNIKGGLDFFERTRTLPTVTIDWRGKYSFR